MDCAEENVDPEFVYTEAEERRLTLQLHRLTQAAHAGDYSERPIDVAVLRELHAAFFDGVRDHAGKIRSRDFGTEYLNFGPNRSERRDRVGKRLDELVRLLNRRLREVDGSQEASNYVDACLAIAVQFHADYVRIHPFQDGNGRTGRLLMDIVLVRVGLSPIPLLAPKDEYNQAMNSYFLGGDIGPVVDVFLCAIDDII